MDAPGSDKSQTENAVKCQIVQAVQAAKSAGKMPGGMEKVLSRVLVPSIDWRDVVADWVGGAFPDDYSYSRPSNRSSGGFVLPGLYSEGMGKIVLAIDTSISVYSHLDTLEAFKGAIEKLRDAYQFEGVVLCCDTAVRAVFTFGRTGPIEFELMGGGGTDFVPVFEWVADNMAGQDIAGLTYFTDLECWSYPAMVPGFPVLWACFGDSWEDDIYRGAVPFGDVVGIDD